MATLSVLNFCSLGHAHSTPKWILDMTHISSSLIRSGKKEQSILNFSLFFLIKFMKIPQNFRKIPQNLMKNSTKPYEKVTKIHEKSHKNSFVMVFTHFLSKKKKYGSFQESTLVHCGRDIGCKNLKLRR